MRAVVWYGDGVTNGTNLAELNVIKLSREHNNANVLSIGARFVTEDAAKKAIMLWLDTSFSNEERHERRNNLIDSIE